MLVAHVRVGELPLAGEGDVGAVDRAVGGRGALGVLPAAERVLLVDVAVGVLGVDLGLGGPGGVDLVVVAVDEAGAAGGLGGLGREVGAVSRVEGGVLGQAGPAVGQLVQLIELCRKCGCRIGAVRIFQQRILRLIGCQLVATFRILVLCGN